MKNNENKKQLTPLDSFKYFQSLQGLIQSSSSSTAFEKLYEKYYGVAPAEELVTDYLKQTNNQDYFNENDSYDESSY